MPPDTLPNGGFPTGKESDEKRWFSRHISLPSVNERISRTSFLVFQTAQSADGPGFSLIAPFVLSKRKKRLVPGMSPERSGSFPVPKMESETGQIGIHPLVKKISSEPDFVCLLE